MENILGAENIHHRIYGTAESKKTPIVFLHGLMGNSSNWGRVWPHFSDSHQVLVLDQRGHGRSAKPQTGYSPGDYAQDLKNLTDHLAWSKFHLVGHSMGGRVAMYFAKMFPEKLASLVLEDSGASARPDRIKWFENLFKNTPVPNPDREQIKNAIFTNHENPMLANFLFSNISKNESELYDWRFHKDGMLETLRSGRCVDAMDVYQNISLPILILRGGKSTEFSAAEAQEMLKKNKLSKLRTIENSGHFVHTEQVEQYCLALQEFFKNDNNLSD